MISGGRWVGGGGAVVSTATLYAMKPDSEYNSGSRVYFAASTGCTIRERYDGRQTTKKRLPV